MVMSASLMVVPDLKTLEIKSASSTTYINLHNPAGPSHPPFRGSASLVSPQPVDRARNPRPVALACRIACSEVVATSEDEALDIAAGMLQGSVHPLRLTASLRTT